MTCTYLVCGLHLAYAVIIFFFCKIGKALVVGYVISIVGPVPQGSQWNSLQVLEIGTPLRIVDF